MSDDFSEYDPVVLILAASQDPGPAIAKACAKAGMRVILIDGDSKALTRIAARDPDQIETLTIPQFQTDAAHRLRDAWGAEPLHLVVNLMPLAQPAAIGEQMRMLAAIMRTTARGLLAGKGSLISIVPKSRDPLGLVGVGRVAAMQAASASLGRTMGKHGVRVHVLNVPADMPEVALDCLLHLGTEAAAHLDSSSFDLGEGGNGRS